VFSPGFIQILHDLRPILPLILSNELKDDKVFLRSPLPLSYALVEVVLPSLPALLGSLEELPIGLPVKLLGDFIPLSKLEIPS
jgi:hypothetical protein